MGKCSERQVSNWVTVRLWQSQDVGTCRRERNAKLDIPMGIFCPRGFDPFIMAAITIMLKLLYMIGN